MEQGFNKSDSIAIETRYHEMHEETDNWVNNHIEEAISTGYVPLAFGGKLRTPILHNSVSLNTLSRQAQEEKRSAGNAMMQSYCTVTVVALKKFMELVHDSKYRGSIRPICTIHDSIYLEADNDLETIKFVNDNLIRIMGIKDLKELGDERLGLPSSLDVNYPDWSYAIELKNDISQKEILETLNNREGINYVQSSKEYTRTKRFREQ